MGGKTEIAKGHMHTRFVGLPIGCALLLLVSSAQGGINAGRTFDNDERPTTICLTLGQFSIDSGQVDETRRAYDNNENPVGYEAFLSSYSFDELGLVGSYPTYGLNFEKQWKYFTLRLEGNYFEVNASTVAAAHPTASAVPARDLGYYISVNEVSFNGQTYERMFIPEGRAVEASVEGGTVALRGLITPFSFSLSDNFITLSPWLHLGVYGVGGQYNIDAGPATGIVQYEVPPETYVVGGNGQGDVYAALPEIGFGSELRIRLGRMRNGDVTLSLQGDLAYLSYSGNTGDLGISEEHEKDLDLTYQNVEFSAMVEFPVSPSYDLVMGVAYRVMTIAMDLSSQHRDEQAQETIYHEKYDKHADFESSFLYGSVGLRF